MRVLPQMLLGYIHYPSTCHPHVHHGPHHTVSGLIITALWLVSLPSDLPLPRLSLQTARAALGLVPLFVSNPSKTTHCHYKEVPTPSHGIRGPQSSDPADLSAFELPLATQPKFTPQRKEFHSVPQNSWAHSSPLPSTFPPTNFLWASHPWMQPAWWHSV